MFGSRVDLSVKLLTESQSLDDDQAQQKKEGCGMDGGGETALDADRPEFPETVLTFTTTAL